MRYAEIEKFCLSLKAATMVVQWGEHHVFKVGGKIFAMLGNADERPQTVSFKASDDSFHILIQLQNIIPAPYLAKSHWVYLERLDALSTTDLKAYLMRAHALIAAKLSKKKQTELGLIAT